MEVGTETSRWHEADGNSLAHVMSYPGNSEASHVMDPDLVSMSINMLLILNDKNGNQGNVLTVITQLTIRVSFDINTDYTFMMVTTHLALLLSYKTVVL